MVMSCAVVSCKNRAKKGSGITFHSFPSDKELLAKWLKAIRREDYKPNDFAKVCSAHFHDDDIYTDKYNRRFVKKGVVPSRFYVAGNPRKIKRHIVFETVPEAANEVVIDSEEIDETESVLENELQQNTEQSINLPPDKHNKNISQESENHNNLNVCQNSTYCQTNSEERLMFDINMYENGSEILSKMSFEEQEFVEEDLSSNTQDPNSSSDEKSIEIKKSKSLKRKREIGLEDFEKINDNRLADPLVVKQLLGIAYKTIQQQRKIITSWRMKYKEMEQKVVVLQRSVRVLKDGHCSW